MEELIRWVKNLIFIILFTTLLEMFLPESSMRKYVRVVMGFFIITIFLSPLAAIFNQDLRASYQVVPGRIIEEDWEAIKKRGEELGEENRGVIREYYQQRMAERIEELVALDYPEYEREVVVQVDQDYQLTGVDISLQQKGDGGIESVEINPVEIEDIGRIDRDSSGRADPPLEAGNTEGVGFKLQQKISQVFLLPVGRIRVKILEGRG